jgi:TolA-binding protein
MKSVSFSTALVTTFAIALLSTQALARPSCGNPSECERSMEDILQQMESRNRDLASQIQDLQRKIDEINRNNSNASSEHKRTLDERLSRLGQGSDRATAEIGGQFMFQACDPGSFMIGLRPPNNPANANDVTKYTTVCRNLKTN